MAKTRQQKSEMLDSYKSLLADNPNYIIVGTDKSGAREVTDLKRELAESGAQFYVLKNTLFKIAAQETGQPIQVQELDGATGVIICGDDPTHPAKVLAKYQKDFSILATKYGVMFGEITQPDQIKSLAEIPSREVLLSMLVGSISAPLTGFMSVIRGNVRQFAYILSEIHPANS